jgi:hypothetical protein
MGFAIAPLDRSHDRKQFACRQSDLDDWFQHRASQDDKRNIARVFVATDDELGVVGFYSLSSFTLAIDELPEGVGRKLPRYDAIHAALIGRLARDIQARGRGIGGLLLADAVRRVLGASRSVAVVVMLSIRFGKLKWGVTGLGKRFVACLVSANRFKNAMGEAIPNCTSCTLKTVLTLLEAIGDLQQPKR